MTADRSTTEKVESAKPMLMITGEPSKKKWTDIYTKKYVETKSAHFLPIQESSSADKLADIFVREIVRLHGVPVSIVSDRDTRFTSRFWRGSRRRWVLNSISVPLSTPRRMVRVSVPSRRSRICSEPAC
ncbi:hypothetical protein OSB04_032104 [Centaurea solstitialis]|uniref:Integrase catalytic domain-containing protein n=1 Tax=Centaurea solstitialis TaxID=347529 RepID=A0AA38SP13_9ASTR|nr:hypothetical protein OSB04_032104 [Centaurea solstitialis]